MNIRVPDSSFPSPREEISEFYLTFSRYEFALKATNYVKQKKWGVVVDWDKLSNDLGELDALLNGRESELHELLVNPPRKLELTETQELKWVEDCPHPGWGETRTFLYRIQAVRNNLMHGSKFLEQESIDPNREIKLLNCACCAIDIILERLPYTKRVFTSGAR